MKLEKLPTSGGLIKKISIRTRCSLFYCFNVLNSVWTEWNYVVFSKYICCTANLILFISTASKRRPRMMLELYTIIKSEERKLDDSFTENLYKPYVLPVPLTKGQWWIWFHDYFSNWPDADRVILFRPFEIWTHWMALLLILS